MKEEDIVKYNENSLTKFNIFLDLDETLLHSFINEEDILKLDSLEIPDDHRLHEDLKIRRILTPDGEEVWIRTVLRPYTKKFIAFCNKFFRIVAIYTAGKKNYAQRMKGIIFEGEKEPHNDYVLSFEHCKQIELENYRDLVTIKPLEYLSERFPEVNSKNTFFLDDNHLTFCKNRNNAIHIKAYCPKPTMKSLSEDDDCLLRLMKWLQKPEVMNCKNVCELEKINIGPDN